MKESKDEKDRNDQRRVIVCQILAAETVLQRATAGLWRDRIWPALVPSAGPPASEPLLDFDSPYKLSRDREFHLVGNFNSALFRPHGRTLHNLAIHVVLRYDSGDSMDWYAFRREMRPSEFGVMFGDGEIHIIGHHTQKIEATVSYLCDEGKELDRKVSLSHPSAKDRRLAAENRVADPRHDEAMQQVPPIGPWPPPCWKRSEASTRPRSTPMLPVGELLPRLRRASLMSLCTGPDPRGSSSCSRSIASTRPPMSPPRPCGWTHRRAPTSPCWAGSSRRSSAAASWRSCPSDRRPTNWRRTKSTMSVASEKRRHSANPLASRSGAGRTRRRCEGQGCGRTVGSGSRIESNSSSWRRTRTERRCWNRGEIPLLTTPADIQNRYVPWIDRLLMSPERIAAIHRWEFRMKASERCASGPVRRR